MTGFTKDTCASMLLGQVWYEQLNEKSMVYLKQLNRDVVQGVSSNLLSYGAPFAFATN